MFIAKIAGVDDRASAGALANAKLFVPRASLPDVGDEEFYLADLIGLTATNEAGGDFGSVVNVLNFGGGDNLEIACPDSSETNVAFAVHQRGFSACRLSRRAI
jgi:16S rRNA processing protein RimM